MELDFNEKKQRKPDWLKVKISSSEKFAEVSKIVNENSLHTICQSGNCPNMGECWREGTATFMILGNICTRSCKFCAVKTGKPLPPDLQEPQKVAESIKLMNLRHAVITSVDRDDLKDGGASLWHQTVQEIRKTVPNCTIEILVPDFKGNKEDIKVVVDAKADILAHNMETVERLSKAVRVQASYQRSLQVLREFKNMGAKITKSGIMLGLSETQEEILQTIEDLKDAKIDILTIGQYLQPTKNHLPVTEYITPEMFNFYRKEAKKIGIDKVLSGPLVRSSYRAKDFID